MVTLLRIFVPVPVSVSVPVFALVIVLVPLTLAPSVTYMAISLHLMFYSHLYTSL
jgi:hypothetical protein